MKRLFILGLLAFATNALAGELWVDLNLASKHSQENYYTTSEATYVDTRAIDKYYGVQTLEIRTEQVCCKANRFNETNPGIGVSYRRKYLEYRVGGFYNSFKDTSLYVAVNAFKKFHVTKKAFIVPGIAIGAFTGYSKSPTSNKNYIIAPQLNVSGEIDKARLILGYVPGKLISETAVNVYTLQLGWRVH